MLTDLLKKKSSQILDRWLQLILETYPADTATLMKNEKDRFMNPVGRTIAEGIKVLYDELLLGMSGEKTSLALENIVRIRCVQDFSPSQAILFVYRLKGAIRDELAAELQGDRIFQEWLVLESKIDDLSLKAFDLYTKCRERICDIRVQEMKSQRDQALKLMARSGMKTVNNEQ